MTRFFAAIAFVFLAFSVSTGAPVDAKKFGEPTAESERALEIARSAATQKGYDISKYRVQDPNHPILYKGKWLFSFICEGRPGPDCGFFVTVDLSSGVSQIDPMG